MSNNNDEPYDDVPECCCAGMEENEKLKRETRLIKDELEQSLRDNAELKAMVNDLRSGIDNAFKSFSAGVSDTFLREAINKTSAQSLHDHCAKCTVSERSERDMVIADAVRGFILSVTERKNAYDLVAEVEENIRNIDLTAIVKGVK